MARLRTGCGSSCPSDCRSPGGGCNGALSLRGTRTVGPGARSQLVPLLMGQFHISNITHPGCSQSGVRIKTKTGSGQQRVRVRVAGAPGIQEAGVCKEPGGGSSNGPGRGSQRHLLSGQERQPGVQWQEALRHFSQDRR